MTASCSACGCTRRHKSTFDQIRRRLEHRLRLAPNGCWEWTGAMNEAGYGFIKLDGKQQRVHRVSYELHVGPIPEGLQIDHLCFNPACANPDHLEPVTAEENLRRRRNDYYFTRLNAAKTHCPQGHPYSGDNLRLTRQGHRVCRACRKP